ncbi:MAG: hypothetical protein JO170_22295 [Verrucomicrobia bacterium]|nr:hypothetical protein [Verrucomicrobiota bacterium]
MKPSAPDFSWPVWAVLPPLVIERIERHYDILYGKGFSGSDALTKFCSEFITDAGFRERIQTRAKELQPVVFDSQDPSWGLWPIDPEECAGIGFFLGLVLESSINDYLADLAEPSLAFLEEGVVNSGKSLEETFIEMLIEFKSLATDPADPAE